MSYLLILIIFYQPIYWTGRLIFNRLVMNVNTEEYSTKIKSWFSSFWGLVSPRVLNKPEAGKLNP